MTSKAIIIKNNKKYNKIKKNRKQIGNKKYIN